MVQPAEDRPSNELAEPLDWPTAWRILVQGQVRPQFVVIRGVARKDPAQMGLAEDDDVIEAFPADRADQSERGSGTLVDARLILAAYGLSENDLQPAYMKSRAAGEKMQAGQLDAFFSVSGWPEGGIAELAATTDVALVPISSPQREALAEKHGFFALDEIPANTYRNVPATKTVSVNAVWVTTSKQPERLIYDVTAALWHPSTRKLLDSGHPKGKAIRFELALHGLGIPLHPGAARFYKEKGALR